MERQETRLAPGAIRAFVAHEHAGRRQACSRASRRGITCRSRLAAVGKAGQAPANPQSCPSMPARKLKSQWHMTATLHTPMSEPSGELERPGSRKWSRNDRVLLDNDDMNHIRRRNPMPVHRRQDRTTADARTRRCHTASANARRDPQITHAPATSCLMYTCVHRRWR